MDGCALAYVLNIRSKSWQRGIVSIVRGMSNMFYNTLGSKALDNMDAKTVDKKYLNKTAPHSLPLRSVLGRAASCRLLAFT